jgi:hypothetical protein
MSAPVTQYTTHVQGVATAGTTVIFTGEVGYNTNIAGITFNSQTVNDITVSVTRVTPASTVIAYAFSLAAGDVISDNNTYILGEGDFLEITTTSAATNYMFTANATSRNSQRVSYQ